MLGVMEMLILLAVVILIDIAAVAGWVADSRTGRDWQPRGGWKPTEDVHLSHRTVVH